MTNNVALLATPRLQFTDTDGAPLVGGQLFTYVPNTFTLSTTWQDPAGTVANTNPITLDDIGSCSVWGAGAYRFILTDINANLIFDAVTSTASFFLTTANTGSYPGGFTFGNGVTQIIFNYGNVVTNSSGIATDTFAIPFPSGCLSVQAIENGADGGAGSPVVVTNYNDTTVTLQVYGATAGVQIDYWAIGIVT